MQGAHRVITILKMGESQHRQRRLNLLGVRGGRSLNLESLRRTSNLCLLFMMAPQIVPSKHEASLPPGQPSSCCSSHGVSKFQLSGACNHCFGRILTTQNHIDFSMQSALMEIWGGVSDVHALCKLCIRTHIALLLSIWVAVVFMNSDLQIRTEWMSPMSICADYFVQKPFCQDHTGPGPDIYTKSDKMFTTMIHLIEEMKILMVLKSNPSLLRGRGGDPTSFSLEATFSPCLPPRSKHAALASSSTSFLFKQLPPLLSPS